MYIKFNTNSKLFADELYSMIRPSPIQQSHSQNAPQLNGEITSAIPNSKQESKSIKEELKPSKDLLKEFSKLAAMSIRIKIDDAVKNLDLDRNDLINELKEWQSTIPLRIDGEYIQLTAEISKSAIEDKINEDKTIISIVGDDEVRKYFSERKIPDNIIRLFLKLDQLMQGLENKIKPEFLKTAIRYKTKKRFFYLKPQQGALSIYLPLRLEDSDLLKPRANGDLWPEFKAKTEKDIDDILPVIKLALIPESERKAKLIKEEVKSSRDFSKYNFNGETRMAKNRLVLAVVKEYVRKHPNITFNILSEIFPPHFQEDFGVFKTLQEVEMSRDPDRFFRKDSEIIHLKDQDIAVCNQWGGAYFLRFVDYAIKELKFNITKAQ